MKRRKSKRCHGRKNAYPDRAEAERAMTHIRENMARAGQPMDHAPKRAYRCECGAWCLTSRLRPRG